MRFKVGVMSAVAFRAHIDPALLVLDTHVKYKQKLDRLCQQNGQNTHLRIPHACTIVHMYYHNVIQTFHVYTGRAHSKHSHAWLVYF